MKLVPPDYNRLSVPEATIPSGTDFKFTISHVLIFFIGGVIIGMYIMNLRNENVEAKK